MILEVHDKTKGTPKPPVYLALKQDGSGIRVIVVNEQGHDINTLLRFNGDGTVSMAASISGQFGFKRNGDGTIVIGDKVY